MKNDEFTEKDYKNLQARVEYLENILKQLLKVQKRQESRIKNLNSNTISLKSDVVNIRAKFKHE